MGCTENRKIDPSVVSKNSKEFKELIFYGIDIP